MLGFLEKRLSEQETVTWASNLNPNQHIERLAIGHLLNSNGSSGLAEPYATAWRLIEESWGQGEVEEGASTAIYGVQERLRAGERSGVLVSMIVSCVAPRLKIESRGAGWQRLVDKKVTRPKTFDDLISVALTSGDLVDLKVLELDKIKELQFLNALATELDAAVARGLDMGRRIGWDGNTQFWQLGFLYRTHYAPPEPGSDEDNEPDAYHRGIAPSVKLLHAVVSRIAALDFALGRQFARRWQLSDSPIYRRLWAALARSPGLISIGDVIEFLSKLSERQFWDVSNFPEIAEMRALRFSEIDSITQEQIFARLRRLPPRSLFPKRAEASRLNEVRSFWAFREMKRLEIAGTTLPPSDQAWLMSGLNKFPELGAADIEEGFPDSPRARSIPYNPDVRFDTLVGIPRLRALEAAFGTERDWWGDNPSGSAVDWILQADKVELVLEDLESAGARASEFPLVWNRFGWTHKPAKSSTGSQESIQSVAAGRVTAILLQLSDETLSAAIEGLSEWTESWKKEVVAAQSGFLVWSRLWPLAVAATNAVQKRSDEDSDLSVRGGAPDNKEPMDLDTLNTPTGKLTGVFLAACPRLPPPSATLPNIPPAFLEGSVPQQMRDIVISAQGRSGLIVRHRMIEQLPYFLRADHDWTSENLVAPLLSEDTSSLALWRAVGRGTRFTDVLRIIGVAMTEKATDKRLGRDTRKSLVFSLIIEALHAYREQREPAVPTSRVQQMLRSVEDEIRAYAANAIQRFVRDLSKRDGSGQPAQSAANLFRESAAPFLRETWPQERSLATPGISAALADLPAVSGEAFVEAVAAIERFLVPFECWSLLNYGLYGNDGESRRISLIDNEPKARALLRLLDLTIGDSEGSVVPHDLSSALEQVKNVAPNLSEIPVYRRLSTLARR
jgi:hypothetical protein